MGVEVASSEGAPPSDGAAVVLAPLERLFASRHLVVWAPRVVVAACLLLYLVHLGFVARNVVDVPFWDEWEFLHPELSAGLASPTLDWLFTRHNEHLLVPTRLQVWALYQLNGWNLVTQQIINFLLFGGLLSWIVWMCCDLTQTRPRWIGVVFVPFLLSPLGWENHLWGFQSQFHLALLGFSIAAWALLGDRMHLGGLVVGVAAAWLAVLSQSAGVTAVAVLVPFVLLCAVRRWRAAEPGTEARRALGLGAVATLGLALAVAFWFDGFPGRLPHHPEFTWPWHGEFWSYFLNVVSFGFGVTERSMWYGLPLFLLVVAPLVLQLLRRRGRVDGAFWTVIALEVGILAVLAALTAGRADPRAIGSKTSRYFLFASMLLPLTAVAWQASTAGLGRDDRLPRLAAAAGLLVLCCSTFANDWDLFRHYANVARERREGLAQIAEYYRAGGSTDFPTLYPRPLGSERLAEARRLRISFYQRYQQTLVADGE